METAYLNLVMWSQDIFPLNGNQMISEHPIKDEEEQWSDGLKYLFFFCEYIFFSGHGDEKNQSHSAKNLLLVGNEISRKWHFDLISNWLFLIFYIFYKYNLSTIKKLFWRPQDQFLIVNTFFLNIAYTFKLQWPFCKIFVNTFSLCLNSGQVKLVRVISL